VSTITVKKQELDACAQKFFDEFVEAFRSFNGDIIALRYLVPYLAFHSDGSAEVFLSSADTAAYFQRILNAYHAKGCMSCGYKELEIVPLGQRCAVATVTWELLADDFMVLESWRESYNLSLVGDRFMIFTSIDIVA
jgi:hypothetical protein